MIPGKGLFNIFRLIYDPPLSKKTEMAASNDKMVHGK
jgi:hypothetical protein